MHHLLRYASKPWWGIKWKGFSLVYLVWLSGILFCICLFCCKAGAKRHEMRVIYYLSINNAKAEKEWISPSSISVTAYKIRVVFLQCQPWTAKFFLHLLLTFPLQIKSPSAPVPAATTCHSAAAAFHPLQWFTAFLSRMKAISKCKCTSQHTALENLLHHRNIQYIVTIKSDKGSSCFIKVCCLFYGSWRGSDLSGLYREMREDIKAKQVQLILYCFLQFEEYLT